MFCCGANLRSELNFIFENPSVSEAASHPKTQIKNTIHTSGVWTEYNSLMWKTDSLSFEDFEQLKNNLLSSLIHSLNKHNHDSFMSLPHHARFIDNLKKCQGLQEASASGLLVRTHLTQPFLLYSLDNLSEEFTNAYSQSWCNNSIFGTFLNGIPTFKPLVVPQYPLPR